MTELKIARFGPCLKAPASSPPGLQKLSPRQYNGILARGLYKKRPGAAFAVRSVNIFQPVAAKKWPLGQQLR
jgi:hypothetical protein